MRDNLYYYIEISGRAAPLPTIFYLAVRAVKRKGGEGNGCLLDQGGEGGFVRGKV